MSIGMSLGSVMAFRVLGSRQLFIVIKSNQV